MKMEAISVPDALNSIAQEENETINKSEILISSAMSVTSETPSMIDAPASSAMSVTSETVATSEASNQTAEEQAVFLSNKGIRKVIEYKGYSYIFEKVYKGTE